jgi:hypothetical protein
LRLIDFEGDDAGGLVNPFAPGGRNPVEIQIGFQDRALATLTLDECFLE